MTDASEPLSSSEASPNRKRVEPTIKKCVAYVDMQAMFRAVKYAFDVRVPDFNPLRLAQGICQERGWQLADVKLYFEIPRFDETEYWHRIWFDRMQELRGQGATTWSVVQRDRFFVTVDSANGLSRTRGKSDTECAFRLGLDAVSDILTNTANVVLLIGPGPRHVELVAKLREIGNEQAHWLKLANAVPKHDKSPGGCRGLDRTDWIMLDASHMEACRDDVPYMHTKRQPRNENTSESATPSVVVATDNESCSITP